MNNERNARNERNEYLAATYKSLLPFVLVKRLDMSPSMAEKMAEYMLIRVGRAMIGVAPDTKFSKNTFRRLFTSSTITEDAMDGIIQFFEGMNKLDDDVVAEIYKDVDWELVD